MGCLCAVTACSKLRDAPAAATLARTQVQLLRIHLRVPEYGWTTQKVFHLLNALVCGVRCVGATGSAFRAH